MKFLGYNKYVLGVASVFAFSNIAHSDVATVEYGEASLVQPSISDTYNLSTSLCDPDQYPNAVCYSPSMEVSPYIKKLSRALGANRLSNEEFTKNVFEYVYQNIEYTPLFGLQKGGVGALLDGYGTAFDQVQLMQLLLKQDGDIGTVKYHLGRLTTDLDTAKNWLGVAYTGSSQSTIADVLSNGGIPASVGTSVEVAHIWLTVNSVVYDPSFKTHSFKDGKTRQQLLGCSGGSCRTAIQNAVAGTETTAQGVPIYSDYDQGALDTHLKNKATSVSANIGRDEKLDDVIGGFKVDVSQTPISALVATRQTSGTGWDMIPDKYRTQFGVKFDEINVVFFADELYGKRLYLNGDVSDAQDPTPFRKASLILENHVVGFPQNSEVGRSEINDPTYSNDHVWISINHPYPANGGNYMDRSNVALAAKIHWQKVTVTDRDGQPQTTTEERFDPHAIVHGWGDVTGGLVTHVNRLVDRESYFIETAQTDLQQDIRCNGRGNTVSVSSSATPVLASCIPSQYLVQGTTWMAQSTKALDIAERTSNSRIVTHHHLGVAGPEAFNAVSGVSVSALDTNTSTKVGQDLSSLVLNRLEGSIAEQLQDSWLSVSAVQLLSLSGLEGRGHTASDFYLVTESTFDKFFGAYGTPALSQGYCGTFNSAQDICSTKENYRYLVTNGYTILMPKVSDISLNYTDSSSVTVGPIKPGVWAYKNGSSALIALHAFKGAAGMDDPDKDALIAAGLLEEQKDEQKLFDVALASGALNLPPVTDIVTGVGSFPYSLAYTRSYDANSATFVRENKLNGGNYSQKVGSLSKIATLPGWTDNYNIRISHETNIDQALGQDSALDAVSTITAFHVLADMIEGADSIKNRVAQAFATNWWAMQMHANSATVQMGGSSQQFIKLPNGSYNPPPLSNDTLEQAGARTERTFGGSKAGYSYEAITFNLLRSNGEVLEFSHPRAGVDGYLGKLDNIFRPDIWRFPTGVNVSFEYGNGYTTVSNNLGRSLKIDYADMTWGGYQHGSYVYAVTDDTGRQVTYGSADNSGTPANEKWYFAKDTEGNLTKYVHKFPANLGLPELVTANSVSEVYLPTDGATPTLSVTYDELQHVKRVENRRGNGTDYYIGGIGAELRRIGESVDALGVRSRSEFNEHGAPVETIQAVGTSDETMTTMIYNDLGQLVRSTQPEGNYTTNVYDSDYNLTKRTWFGVHGASYSSEANYTTKTRNYGSISATIYGVLNWVKDANSNTISFAFNNKGLLETVTYPTVAAGTPVQSFTYNDFGQITTATSQENIVTKYTYSGIHSELSSVIENYRNGEPASNDTNLTTTYTYDSVGNQIAVNGPLANVNGKDDIVSTLYDKMRRPVYVVQAAMPSSYGSSNTIGAIETGSGTEHYSYTDYDGLGRPRIQSSRGRLRSGGGLSSNFTNYDTQTYYTLNGQPCSGSGQVCRVIGPDGAVTTTYYDALDRVDYVVDGAGRKTKTIYDKLGRPLKIIKAWGSPDEITYQEYAYTPNGKVDWVKDANGNKTNYKYDQFDRLGKTEFPHKTSVGSHNINDYESYIYDSNGNMVAKRTRKADWIINSYDALNRLAKKQVYRGGNWNGSTVTGGTTEYIVDYTYLKDGRDDTITQTAGSTVVGPTAPFKLTYVYDGAGRQIEEIVDHQYANVQYVTKSELDAAGNRTKLTHPNGHMVVNYGYDHLGRMTKAALYDEALGKVTYNYDGFSRRSSASFYNGGGGFKSTLYAYEKDNALKMLSHDFVGTDSDIRFDFGYNMVNQIVNRELTNSKYRFQMVAGTKHLDYDKNGLNQYTKISTLDTNAQPTSSTTPAYDDNGSFIYDGGNWHYAYDAENRLVQATKTNGSNTEYWEHYQYGPKGRRLKSTSMTGINNIYVYDGDEPIADYNGGTHVVERQFVNGAGVDERLMYIKYGSGGNRDSVSYYHANHQGSIVGLSRQADGSSEAIFTYDAYGNVGVGENNGQPFRFTGRRFDAETGLYYYRARYYSSNMGRFLQTDPIGYEDNMNLYGYTGNDPVNLTDPSGKTATTVAGAGIGCAVSGPACPVGAAVGAVIGTVVGVVGGIILADAIEEATTPDIPDPVEDLLGNTTPGEKTKGRTTNHEKPGTIDTANGDFDGIVDPDTVQDRGNGTRTGETSDGRKVNVRPNSSDGRPTIEIQDGKKKDRFVIMTQTKTSNEAFVVWGESWSALAPYKIDKIVDSVDGLEIYVSGTRGNTAAGVFRFDEYYGYRNFDEGDLWKRWKDIGVLPSGTYVAERSELLDWAAQQSAHEALPEGVLNYLFVTIDDVFDVLAFEAPTFELLKT